MAIVKTFACDLCGAAVEKLAIRVFRVGTAEDRPEDCNRLDIGPECYGEGGEHIATVIRAWMKAREDDGWAVTESTPTTDRPQHPAPATTTGMVSYGEPH